MISVTRCSSLAGAVLLFACTDSKPKGVDALAQAVCEYTSRCAAQMSFPFSSVDACRRYYTGYLRSPVAAGSVVIDETAVPACVASLDTAPCTPTNSLAYSPACHDAIAADAAQVGEDCRGKACETGAYCDYSAGGSWDGCPVCATSRALDESCSYDFQCESDRCDRDGGGCVPPAGEGEACTASYECASAHCDGATSTCDAGRHPNGESCVYDGDCQSNRCALGTCAARLGQGAACEYDEDCAAELACVGHVCTAFDFWRQAALGEVCRFFCVDGAWCPNDLDPDPTCRPYTAVGDPCAEYDECGPDAYCSSSSGCTAYLSVGAPCTASSQCASHRCNGTCEADACVSPAP